MLKPVAAMALALMAVGTHAATLEFTYSDPARFTDIRETNGVQSKFEKRVLEAVAAEFRRQAGKLPADQVLKVELQDLDMAGTVDYFVPGFPFGLRIIHNVDFPSMKLHFELLGANKQVVKSGDDKFSDLGFRDDVLVMSDSRDFKYEKRMVQEWFARNLLPPPLSLRD